MARECVKTLGNYLSLGNGGMRTLLEGAPCISFHAHCRIDTVDADDLGNPLTHILISSSGTVGFSFNIDGTGPRVSVNGRSGSTDSRRHVIGTTVLSLGTWYRVGGYLDFANDVARVFLNGTPDVAETAASFVNASFTYASAPADPDGLGVWSPTVSVVSHFDGGIAEVAFWNRKLTVREFQTLGAGYAPARIRTGLAAYWRLLGNDSPEPNWLRTGPDAAIVGTVAKARHPRVIW